MAFRSETKTRGGVRVQSCIRRSLAVVAEHGSRRRPGGRPRDGCVSNPSSSPLGAQRVDSARPRSSTFRVQLDRSDDLGLQRRSTESGLDRKLQRPGGFLSCGRGRRCVCRIERGSVGLCRWLWRPGAETAALCGPPPAATRGIRLLQSRTGLSMRSGRGISMRMPSAVPVAVEFAAPLWTGRHRWRGSDSSPAVDGGCRLHRFLRGQRVRVRHPLQLVAGQPAPRSGRPGPGAPLLPRP